MAQNKAVCIRYQSTSFGMNQYLQTVWNSLKRSFSNLYQPWSNRLYLSHNKISQKIATKNCCQRLFVFSVFNALSDGVLNTALCVALQNESLVNPDWLLNWTNQQPGLGWNTVSKLEHIIWKSIELSRQEDCLWYFFTHFCVWQVVPHSLVWLYVQM